MLSKLTIVKLLDGTKLFARKVKNSKRKKMFFVGEIKWMRDGDRPRYLQDVDIGISYDAIEVFFILHKGDKEPVKPQRMRGPHFKPKDGA